MFRTTGWRGRLQRAANRHRRAAHCITSADAGSANVVAGFFASSAAFGAAFEFFAQLCELGNALAVHRSAAGVPDSDISPGIVLLWHFKSRRILGWTFQI